MLLRLRGDGTDTHHRFECSADLSGESAGLVFSSMRILQIHTMYRQSGGEEAVLDAEAKVLRGAGHDVHQMIAQNPDGSVSAAVNMAAAVWNPVAVHRVRKMADVLQPDVIHFHNTWFALSPAVIRAVRSKSASVVMTLHNYRLTCANALLLRDGSICELCVGSNPWKAVKYSCYRDSKVLSAVAAGTLALHSRLGTWVEGVDRFVVLTDFQRQIMMRAGLPERKLKVKPHFVDDPGPRNAPPSQSNVVLFVGRVVFEKGVDRLIDAWRHADTGDLELWIVGDGPMRLELEALAPIGVRFLGSQPRERVAELMLSARAGVMPSIWYEGMPMVALEFIAAGAPMVVSRSAAISELLGRHLGEQWIVTKDEDWVGALGALADGGAIDAASLRSRTLYLDVFTPGRGLELLEELYSEIEPRKGHSSQALT